MIVMRLSGEALTFFSNAAKVFPKEVRSAFGRVASTVRNRMRKAMRIGGGIHGVPPFPIHAAITNFLRGYHPIGGKLTLPHMIQAFKPKQDVQMIGFLTALDPYARAFQSASKRPFTKEERRMMYIRGIKGKEMEHDGAKWNTGLMEFVRKGYDRPARPIVDPLVVNASPELPKWINGAFHKALMRGKQMKVAA
jgi:hypothetical protein